MRYGIFSDVHSNLEALRIVVDAYEKESIDKYLCIGDVVGYAANPNECIDIVKGICGFTVAGNHDWACVGLLSDEYFNPIARRAVFWTADNLGREEKSFLESLKLTYKEGDFMLVHGTLDNPGDFNYLTDGYSAQLTFGRLDTSICFVGHTHTPGIFVREDAGIRYSEADSIDVKSENKYIVNVGSVGQPRDGNPKAAYCVYDSEKKEIRIKRVSYDMELARKKIVESGLSILLGDRLLSGR